MSAPRKLPPEAEAAIIAWYSQYQQALDHLRKLGSIAETARQYGISTRGVRVIGDREGEKMRRALAR